MLEPVSKKKLAPVARNVLCMHRIRQRYYNIDTYTTTLYIFEPLPPGLWLCCDSATKLYFVLIT